MSDKSDTANTSSDAFNTPANPAEFATALIISVGGTPAPVIYTISEIRPGYIAFICSEDTQKLCNDIIATCKIAPARYTVVKLTNPEILGTCYKEIRKAIRDLSELWQLPVENITVDYTGGTKTMSAALVLAAAETFNHFSYVGGGQRTKEGVGVVIDGREERRILTNPWKELAVREIERAGILWDNQQYKACAELIVDITKRVPCEQRKPYRALQMAAEGLAARRAFNLHPLAKDRMHSACGNLKECNASTKPLSDFCQAALDRFMAFGRCKDNKATIDDYNKVLAELLDNALLTARTHRYEDACARLYRYMEFQAQVWLWEMTNGAFHLGKLVEGREIPPQLSSMDKIVRMRPGDDKLMFALEDDYQALDRLGHVRAKILVQDFNKDTRWRNATSLRNSSVLAHGLSNVTNKSFTQYKEALEHYLGVDTSLVSLEVPKWNPDWLLTPEPA